LDSWLTLEICSLRGQEGSLVAPSISSFQGREKGFHFSKAEVGERKALVEFLNEVENSGGAMTHNHGNEYQIKRVHRDGL
jgi:hypothetical protein